MRQRRKKHKFTPEQVQMLAQNPFTYSVNAIHISYTLEFKNLFLVQYEAGEYVKDIFTNLGYDVSVLGDNRIYNFAYKLGKQAENGELPTEEAQNVKVQKPVHIDYNTMPTQQSTAAMQRELKYLRQQVEFLKKISEAGETTK